MLISEDRCDLAYPQLTALDTVQHEPTAQAHIEFQRAFCERILKEPSRAYDRLRDLDLPALDDYRRFWMARSLEDMDQTDEAIAEYENFLATSTNPILRNSASLRLAALYRTAGQPAKALAPVRGAAPARHRSSAGPLLARDHQPKTRFGAGAKVAFRVVGRTPPFQARPQ